MHWWPIFLCSTISFASIGYTANGDEVFFRRSYWLESCESAKESLFVNSSIDLMYSEMVFEDEDSENKRFPVTVGQLELPKFADNASAYTINASARGFSTVMADDRNYQFFLERKVPVVLDDLWVSNGLRGKAVYGYPEKTTIDLTRRVFGGPVEFDQIRAISFLHSPADIMCTSENLYEDIRVFSILRLKDPRPKIRFAYKLATGEHDGFALEIEDSGSQKIEISLFNDSESYSIMYVFPKSDSKTRNRVLSALSSVQVGLSAH